jgi:DNA-directed RNA polymerase specialized sigma24 family protein
VSDVFDGNSAEDMPGIVLLEYFESETGLGWNPAVCPLNRFLMVVLKRRMIDRLRRQQFIVGSLDDPDLHKLLPTLKPEEPSEAELRLQEAARGDPDLEELVTAMRELDGNSKSNQQLASILHTTEKDIVNRKKRLKRRLKAQGK